MKGPHEAAAEGLRGFGRKGRSRRACKGMRTMEQIKMAVLGMNQGSKTARDAVANPEVDLVAVAGRDEQDREIAAELGVPIYDDYELLLKQEDLDAVWISLPNQLHRIATENAVAAGIKFILLDKPIADTVEDAEAIIKVCNDAGATLLIGHHRRSSSKYLLLREIIDSGRLGDVVGIQSSFAIAKAHSYFDVEWRVTEGGGPLLINAIHDFDDLNYVTGAHPVKVYATTRNTIRHNPVEDSAQVIVEYDNGVTAGYFISDGTPSPWNYDLAAFENPFLTMAPGENSMHVFGTKGSFGFPNMDLYYYDENDFGWWSPMLHEHFEYEKIDPYVSELAHLVDLVKGRETVPRCSGENGLDTLKVINAIKESAATGEAVRL